MEILATAVEFTAKTNPFCRLVCLFVCLCISFYLCLATLYIYSSCADNFGMVW